MTGEKKNSRRKRVHGVLGVDDIPAVIKEELSAVVHRVTEATFKKIRGARVVVGLCGSVARHVSYEDKYITCVACNIAGNYIDANQLLAAEGDLDEEDEDGANEWLESAAAALVSP